MSGVDLFGDVTTVDDGDRSDFDYYPTPQPFTRSLLHFHPAIVGATVLEPCSGGDAITTVLRAAGCSVATNDLDRRHPALTHFDATEPRYWDDMPADAFEWVITNPPFNEALPILQGAIRAATIGVAFLLRKTFLEPTDGRGPWLQAHPPTRAIGLPRYAFRGQGTDSVPCDWFIWERRPDRSLPPFVIDYVAERRVR